MKKTALSILIFSFLFISKNLFADFSWTRMSDYAGGTREFAFGFSVGGYGYAGTGRNPTDHNDFWQFDPVSNTWTQKSNYPGSGRYGMIGFAIGNYGYAGTGWRSPGGGSYQYKDFWQYDPASNNWTQKTDFGGSARYSAVGFSIGNKGYVGLGHSPLQNDFWEYDPITDSWLQKANFPYLRQAAIGFGLGNKGYVGTGYMNGTHYNDFYEYDPVNDTWTQKSSVPGLLRRGAVGFSMGGYGYVGMGYNDLTYLTDFAEYNPATDTWNVIASIGGVPRYGSFAFSINGFGYVGTGSYGGVVNVISQSDFWRLSKCGETPSAINNIFKQKSISINVSSDHHKGLLLNYDLGAENEAVFNCYDALGKLVVSTTLLPANHIMTIPVLLSSDIYFYSVLNADVVLESGKVVVN